MQHFSSESISVDEENNHLVNSSSSQAKISKKMTSSIKTSSTDESQGIVIEPEEDEEEEVMLVTSPASPSTVAKFGQQFRSSSGSRTSTNSGAFRAMKSVMNDQQINRVQTDDSETETATSVSAMKAKIEGDNYVASKSAAQRMDRETVRSGDTIRNAASMTKGVSSKIQTPDLEAENTSFQSKKEQTIVSPGRFEKNMSASSSSSRFFKSSGSSMTKQHHHSSSSSSMMQTLTSHGSLSNLLVDSFDGTPLNLTTTNNNLLAFPGMLAITLGSKALSDIHKTSEASDQKTLEAEYGKAEKKMNDLVDKLKAKGITRDALLTLLPSIKDTLKKSWFLLGVELSSKLCDKFKSWGALDIILDNCKNEEDEEVQRLSACVLHYCLSIGNVAHSLASNDSCKLVNLVTSIQDNQSASTTFIRAGVGIISHLFMSSEEACKELIKRGALETVISFCRSPDVETQRNCAYALANLALFGGTDSQIKMIKANVLDWLLVLGFSIDEYVRYNACHAMAILVSNKEIEASVSNSNCFMLVEQFVEQHPSPREFSENPLSKYYGQSREWLKRYISVLDSDSEDAKSLAAFHFALSAFIRKRQGDVSIFSKEVPVLQSLNKVASSPNATASKFAGQALKLIGVEVPHKLSQQVPLWSVEDVKEWIKQIGFESLANNFTTSKVDGDLLLQLTEDMLKEDIGIKNGILRKRFMRELAHLKRITDYSSCDPTHVADTLEALGPVYLQYAYNLLNSGVDMETLKSLNEDDLANECKIDNSIHRLKILKSIQETRDRELSGSSGTASEKTLDVFVSYRRSNGSQLASLLKVLLQMRGFSTFLDIERLEAGKFDCNLIDNIRKAKNFILVLTPHALDRCLEDKDCKDWVHREIVEAIKSNCNIIPIVENFEWPEPEQLPEDIRVVSRFNGIKWIHEYQDACIDKLDRFIKGILTSTDMDQQNASLRSGLMSPTNNSGTVSLVKKR